MSLWQRHKQDRELADELESHLRMAARDLAERGYSPKFAAEAARRELGNVGLIKEVTRDMWSWTPVERLLQDLRYSLRVIRKSPGYASVAIFSLALGIGANTAIFSLIDAVMLKSLPVREPRQLVSIGDPTRTGGVSQNSGGRVDLLSYPFYQRLREHDGSFSDIYAIGRSEHLDIAAVEGTVLNSQGVQPHGRFVTGNFFSVLGVPTLLGRTFNSAETRAPGSSAFVVIGYSYWVRQFARDQSILGRKLLVNGSPFTVIGVMPPGFTGDIVGSPTDIWFPLNMKAQANPGHDYLNDAQTHWLLLMGRLKPGVSLAQAAGATNVRGKQIFRELYQAKTPPDDYRFLMRQTIPVASGARGFSHVRQDFSTPLLMLMAVVALVLLICCANVANLQLARASSRQREMSLRLAIGAGRGRLLRQLLTESLLLSLAGGALGLVFAYWVAHLLLRLISESENLPVQIQLDTSVLLFTLVTATLAGLLFGLAPALQSTRTDLVSGLKESRAGQSQGSARAFGKMLIVAQVVFSMILLAGAGLFIQTLRNLKNTEVGYARDGLVLAEVDFKTAGYDGKTLGPLTHRLLDKIAQAPGVQAVTLSENGLFSGTESSSDSAIEGYVPHGEADRSNSSDQVGPDYFRIVGTPVLAGRGITWRDTETAPKVAVVNESLARFYFPHASPLGRHIFEEPGGKGAVYTIVGVVRDTKQGDLRVPSPRRFYLPFLQHLDGIVLINLEIRVRGSSTSAIDSIRRAISAVNGKLPVLSLKSANTLIDKTLDQERLVAKLSSFFGLLALLLAAIGLYGVLSYMTVRRTTEIGIRMALGAARNAVVRMLLRETFALLSVGLAIGALGALVTAALLQKILFGLSYFEAVPLLSAAAAIVFASALATFLPAWRASQVDPTVALRDE